MADGTRSRVAARVRRPQPFVGSLSGTASMVAPGDSYITSARAHDARAPLQPGTPQCASMGPTPMGWVPPQQVYPHQAQPAALGLPDAAPSTPTATSQQQPPPAYAGYMGGFPMPMHGYAARGAPPRRPSRPSSSRRRPRARSSRPRSRRCPPRPASSSWPPCEERRRAQRHA